MISKQECAKHRFRLVTVEAHGDRFFFRCGNTPCIGWRYVTRQFVRRTLWST
jgi:hypothetical protein